MGILFRDTSVEEGMKITKKGKKILEVILKETSGKDKFKIARLEVKYLGKTYIRLMACGNHLNNLPEDLKIGLATHQSSEEKARIFYKAEEEYKFDRITSRCVRPPDICRK